MSYDGEDMKHCVGCDWMYQPRPTNDLGLCGTCAREAALEPRSAETDELDRRIRAQQRAERAVA